MRLLLADDDTIYRMFLGRELSKWGYEVVSASDGAGALAALEDKAGPSLAILDWSMPGADGVEVCRRVRANSEGRYIYLLLLTARDKPEDLIAGMDAGADDYLTSPWTWRSSACASAPVAGFWNSRSVRASSSTTPPSPTMRPTRAASSFV